MFQFSALANVHLWIQCTTVRESRDQRSLDSYPRLIAACHALLRLLTPRHPPCALNSLTTWTQHSHPRRAAFREDRPAMGTPDPMARYQVRAAAIKPLLGPSNDNALPPVVFDRLRNPADDLRYRQSAFDIQTSRPCGTTSPGPSNEMPLKPTAKLSKILSAQPQGAGTPSCPADRACQIDRGRIPFPFAPANGIRNPSPVHLSNSAHPRQGRTASIPTGPIPVKALPGRNRISFAIDRPLR